MRKKLFIVLLTLISALCIAFAFTACDGGSGGGSDDGYSEHVHSLRRIEEKQPSCEEHGNPEYYVCSDCGRIFYDEEGLSEIYDPDFIMMEPLHHVMTSYGENSATCTEDGNRAYYVCERCNKWYYDENGFEEITNKNAVVIPAHGHNLREVEEFPASCQNEGNIAYYVCSDCGKWFYDEDCTEEITDENDVVIPAKAHSLTHVDENPATCTENGNRAYYVCDDCGNWYEDEQGKILIYDKSRVIIYTQGHSLTYIEEDPKTCTEDGTIGYYYCETCHKSFRNEYSGEEITDESEFIIPKGHDLVYVSANPATCTKEGNTGYYVCRDCDKWFSDWEGTKEITDKSSVVIPITHNVYTQRARTADCTQDGNIEYYVCYNCGKWFYDEECTREITDKNDVVIPATGHTIVHHHAQDATCTEDGNEEYYECSTCGTWFEDEDCNEIIYYPYTYIIQATGHSLVDVFRNEATCTEDGNIYYYFCEHCEKLFSDMWGNEEITDENDVVIPATGHNYSTEWDYTTTQHWRECTVCHEKTDIETHSLTDHDCAICGAENYTEGLIFSLNYNETYYTVTGGENAVAEVIIPSKYYGKPVTAIGNQAFKDWEDLVSITIPDCVTSIGESAFNNCSNLNAITLPESLQSIGSYAFYGCSKIQSLSFPEELLSIGGSAFSGCSLTEIKLPDGLTTIANSAFSDCPVQTATIPASAAYAFGHWVSGIKTVRITTGDLVTSDFSDCETLTEVYLAEDSTTIGQSVFSGCSNLVSVTIPNGVTKISDYAFHNCTGLENIKLPESLTNIGSSAFAGCSSLKGIIIPDGISGLPTNMLTGCSSLTNIVIPDSVTTITGIGFGCPIETATIPAIAASTIRNDNLKTVKITSGESIRYSALYDCISLESVILPESITSIGESAFSGCTLLESINLPKNLTSIGDHAFNGCAALKEVEIPYGVTELESVFYGCTGLTKVTVPDSVTSLTTAFYNCPIESAIIPGIAIGSIKNANLKEVVITNGESIKDNAFNGCALLESVTLPAGITSIGKLAFNGCELLETISLPEGVTSIGESAFSGCTNLTKISIPDSITRIYKDAFSGCDNLIYTQYKNPNDGEYYSNTYYLGNSENPYAAAMKPVDTESDQCGTKNTTKVIADYAYSGYTNLKYFAMDGGVYIGAYAFSNCTQLNSINPNMVIEIYEYAFSGCSSMERIVLPVVERIGAYAFERCSLLQDIRVESVVEINEHAFYYCSSLESISLPAIERLGDYVFASCGNLKTVSIGDGIKYVGKAVLSQCNNFEFTEEDNLLYIGNSQNPYLVLVDVEDVHAFTERTMVNANTKVIAGWALLLAKVKSIVLPEGLITIGESAFSSCDELTEIVIPDSVTYIGFKAFSDCSALTSVTIPGSVKNLEASMFTGCTALTEVVLLDGVEYLDAYIFYGCSNLTKITIPVTVNYLGMLSFCNCSKLTNITYNGTAAQWAEIVKESDWKTNTGNYTVRCSDKNISKALAG